MLSHVVRESENIRHPRRPSYLAVSVVGAFTMVTALVALTVVPAHAGANADPESVSTADSGNADTTTETSGGSGGENDDGNGPSVQPAGSSSTAERAAAHAKSKVGAPYSWGASGPNAFDCSGLTQWSYKKAGIDLPRTTYAQINAGKRVSRDNLRPGDLVFFYEGPGHVGLYLGDGTMVHAPNADKSVEVVTMADYYDSVFVGAVRVA